MRPNHLVGRLVDVVLAVVVLLVAGVDASSLLFLAIALACPLMMVVIVLRLMRGMGGHDKGTMSKSRDSAATRPDDRIER